MKPLTNEIKNFIQYGTEERQWEFKPPMSWKKNQEKQYEIAKAIFALSNIPNGGFIVFGIYEDQNNSKGVKYERRGLTTEQFNSFENKDAIGRFLNGKTNHTINFEIYGGTILINNQEKKFIVMQVYESQEAIPVICIDDYNCLDKSSQLKKYCLYIRSISNPIESRPIQTNEEWSELIRRLLGRKEEILFKDLELLCKNMEFKKKEMNRTKPRKLLRKNQYDKYLKRDGL